MNKESKRTVNCPGCQKPVVWSNENHFRPFCSERCQLIDFGEWATEKHSIAGESFYPTDDDDPEQLQ